jgi:hypothetical protein
VEDQIPQSDVRPLSEPQRGAAVRDRRRAIGERESSAQVLVEEAQDRFLTKWTYGEPSRLPAA